MQPIRVLLVYAADQANRTFSYQHGWPRHFLCHPRFRCTPLNLADRQLVARVRAHMLAGRDRWDAVVLLHSVFSNACMMGDRLRERLARLSAPKAYFIGNEYKLMPEKMAFADALELALLVSQTNAEPVHALYRERLRCAVVGIPNTGLDPALFQPRTPDEARSIDLGYRSDDSPEYLGHDERRQIAAFFVDAAARHRLRIDISLRPEDRLGESDWARFLDRCRGQIGTEAGGDYFELTDARRLAVNAYRAAHPRASREEIFARFFASAAPCPIRILSGRNVESAGTKTVQVLLEGHYNGYFLPDIHYIPLRKDFGDADAAIEKFKDVSFRAKIADNAYDLAIGELTYERLIDRFYEALATSL
jgi:hypothetical protein